MITINDRATDKLWMKKLESKDTAQLANQTYHITYAWKNHIHTIKVDNSKEFASHAKSKAALEVDVYFTRPYHSWETSDDENLNGL